MKGKKGRKEGRKEIFILKHSSFPGVGALSM
jgi:hypothetical protein